MSNVRASGTRPNLGGGSSGSSSPFSDLNQSFSRSDKGNRFFGDLKQTLASGLTAKKDVNDKKQFITQCMRELSKLDVQDESVLNRFITDVLTSTIGTHVSLLDFQDIISTMANDPTQDRNAKPLIMDMLTASFLTYLTQHKSFSCLDGNKISGKNPIRCQGNLGYISSCLPAFKQSYITDIKNDVREPDKVINELAIIKAYYGETVVQDILGEMFKHIDLDRVIALNQSEQRTSLLGTSFKKAFSAYLLDELQRVSDEKKPELIMQLSTVQDLRGIKDDQTYMLVYVKCHPGEENHIIDHFEQRFSKEKLEDIKSKLQNIVAPVLGSSVSLGAVRDLPRGYAELVRRTIASIDEALIKKDLLLDAQTAQEFMDSYGSHDISNGEFLHMLSADVEVLRQEMISSGVTPSVNLIDVRDTLNIVYLSMKYEGEIAFLERQLALLNKENSSSLSQFGAQVSSSSELSQLLSSLLQERKKEFETALKPYKKKYDDLKKSNAKWNEIIEVQLNQIRGLSSELNAKNKKFLGLTFSRDKGYVHYKSLKLKIAELSQRMESFSSSVEYWNHQDLREKQRVIGVAEKGISDLEKAITELQTRESSHSNDIVRQELRRVRTTLIEKTVEKLASLKLIIESEKNRPSIDIRTVVLVRSELVHLSAYLKKTYDNELLQDHKKHDAKRTDSSKSALVVIDTVNYACKSLDLVLQGLTKPSNPSVLDGTAVVKKRRKSHNLDALSMYSKNHLIDVKLKSLTTFYQQYQKLKRLDVYLSRELEKDNVTPAVKKKLFEKKSQISTLLNEFEKIKTPQRESLISYRNAVEGVVLKKDKEDLSKAELDDVLLFTRELSGLLGRRGEKATQIYEEVGELTKGQRPRIETVLKEQQELSRVLHGILSPRTVTELKKAQEQLSFGGLYDRERAELVGHVLDRVLFDVSSCRDSDVYSESAKELLKTVCDWCCAVYADRKAALIVPALSNDFDELLTQVNGLRGVVRDLEVEDLDVEPLGSDVISSRTNRLLHGMINYSKSVSLDSMLDRLNTHERKKDYMALVGAEKRYQRLLGTLGEYAVSNFETVLEDLNSADKATEYKGYQALTVLVDRASQQLDKRVAELHQQRTSLQRRIAFYDGKIKGESDPDLLDRYTNMRQVLQASQEKVVHEYQQLAPLPNAEKKSTLDEGVDVPFKHVLLELQNELRSVLNGDISDIHYLKTLLSGDPHTIFKYIDTCDQQWHEGESEKWVALTVERDSLQHLVRESSMPNVVSSEKIHSISSDIQLQEWDVSFQKLNQSKRPYAYPERVLSRGKPDPTIRKEYDTQFKHAKDTHLFYIHQEVDLLEKLLVGKAPSENRFQNIMARLTTDLVDYIEHIDGHNPRLVDLSDVNGIFDRLGKISERFHIRFDGLMGTLESRVYQKHCTRGESIIRHYKKTLNPLFKEALDNPQKLPGAISQAIDFLEIVHSQSQGYPSHMGTLDALGNVIVNDILDSLKPILVDIDQFNAIFSNQPILSRFVREECLAVQIFISSSLEHQTQGTLQCQNGKLMVEDLCTDEQVNRWGGSIRNPYDSFDHHGDKNLTNTILERIYSNLTILSSIHSNEQKAQMSMHLNSRITKVREDYQTLKESISILPKDDARRVFLPYLNNVDRFLSSSEEKTDPTVQLYEEQSRLVQQMLENVNNEDVGEIKTGMGTYLDDFSNLSYSLSVDSLTNDGGMIDLLITCTDFISKVDSAVSSVLVTVKNQLMMLKSEQGFENLQSGLSRCVNALERMLLYEDPGVDKTSDKFLRMLSDEPGDVVQKNALKKVFSDRISGSQHAYHRKQLIDKPMTTEGDLVEALSLLGEDRSQFYQDVLLLIFFGNGTTEYPCRIDFQGFPNPMDEHIKVVSFFKELSENPPVLHHYFRTIIESDTSEKLSLTDLKRELNQIDPSRVLTVDSCSSDTVLTEEQFKYQFASICPENCKLDPETVVHVFGGWSVLRNEKGVKLFLLNRFPFHERFSSVSDLLQSLFGEDAISQENVSKLISQSCGGVAKNEDFQKTISDKVKFFEGSEHRLIDMLFSEFSKDVENPIHVLESVLNRCHEEIYPGQPSMLRFNLVFDFMVSFVEHLEHTGFTDNVTKAAIHSYMTREKDFYPESEWPKLLNPDGSFKVNGAALEDGIITLEDVFGPNHARKITDILTKLNSSKDELAVVLARHYDLSLDLAMPLAKAITDLEELDKYYILRVFLDGRDSFESCLNQLMSEIQFQKDEILSEASLIAEMLFNSNTYSMPIKHNLTILIEKSIENGTLLSRFKEISKGSFDLNRIMDVFEKECDEDLPFQQLKEALSNGVVEHLFPNYEEFNMPLVGFLQTLPLTYEFYNHLLLLKDEQIQAILKDPQFNSILSKYVSTKFPDGFILNGKAINPLILSRVLFQKYIEAPESDAVVHALYAFVFSDGSMGDDLNAFATQLGVDLDAEYETEVGRVRTDLYARLGLDQTNPRFQAVFTDMVDDFITSYPEQFMALYDGLCNGEITIDGSNRMVDILNTVTTRCIPSPDRSDFRKGLVSSLILEGLRFSAELQAYIVSYVNTHPGHIEDWIKLFSQDNPNIDMFMDSFKVFVYQDYCVKENIPDAVSKPLFDVLKHSDSMVVVTLLAKYELRDLYNALINDNAVDRKTKNEILSRKLVALSQGACRYDRILEHIKNSADDKFTELCKAVYEENKFDISRKSPGISDTQFFMDQVAFIMNLVDDAKTKLIGDISNDTKLKEFIAKTLIIKDFCQNFKQYAPVTEDILTEVINSVDLSREDLQSLYGLLYSPYRRDCLKNPIIFDIISKFQYRCVQTYLETQDATLIKAVKDVVSARLTAVFGPTSTICGKPRDVMVSLVLYDYIRQGMLADDTGFSMIADRSICDGNLIYRYLVGGIKRNDFPILKTKLNDYSENFIEQNLESNNKKLFLFLHNNMSRLHDTAFNFDVRKEHNLLITAKEHHSFIKDTMTNTVQVWNYVSPKFQKQHPIPASSVALMKELAGRVAGANLVFGEDYEFPMDLLVHSPLNSGKFTAHAERIHTLLSEYQALSRERVSDKKKHAAAKLVKEKEINGELAELIQFFHAPKAPIMTQIVELLNYRDKIKDQMTNVSASNEKALFGREAVFNPSRVALVNDFITASSDEVNVALTELCAIDIGLSPQETELLERILVTRSEPFVSGQALLSGERMDFFKHRTEFNGIIQKFTTHSASDLVLESIRANLTQKVSKYLQTRGFVHQNLSAYIDGLDLDACAQLNTELNRGTLTIDALGVDAVDERKYSLYKHLKEGFPTLSADNSLYESWEEVKRVLPAKFEVRDADEAAWRRLEKEIHEQGITKTSFINIVKQLGELVDDKELLKLSIETYCHRFIEKSGTPGDKSVPHAFLAQYFLKIPSDEFNRNASAFSFDDVDRITSHLLPNRSQDLMTYLVGKFGTHGIFGPHIHISTIRERYESVIEVLLNTKKESYVQHVIHFLGVNDPIPKDMKDHLDESLCELFAADTLTQPELFRISCLNMNTAEKKALAQHILHQKLLAIGYPQEVVVEVCTTYFENDKRVAFFLGNLSKDNTFNDIGSVDLLTKFVCAPREINALKNKTNAAFDAYVQRRKVLFSSKLDEHFTKDNVFHPILKTHLSRAIDGIDVTLDNIREFDALVTDITTKPVESDEIKGWVRRLIATANSFSPGYTMVENILKQYVRDRFKTVAGIEINNVCFDTAINSFLSVTDDTLPLWLEMCSCADRENIDGPDLHGSDFFEFLENEDFEDIRPSSSLELYYLKEKLPRRLIASIPDGLDDEIFQEAMDNVLQDALKRYGTDREQCDVLVEIDHWDDAQFETSLEERSTALSLVFPPGTVQLVDQYKVLALQEFFSEGIRPLSEPERGVMLAKLEQLRHPLYDFLTKLPRESVRLTGDVVFKVLSTVSDDKLIPEFLPLTKRLIQYVSDLEYVLIPDAISEMICFALAQDEARALCGYNAPDDRALEEHVSYLKKAVFVQLLEARVPFGMADIDAAENDFSRLIEPLWDKATSDRLKLPMTKWGLAHKHAINEVNELLELYMSPAILTAIFIHGVEAKTAIATELLDTATDKDVRIQKMVRMEDDAYRICLRHHELNEAVFSVCPLDDAKSFEEDVINYLRDHIQPLFGDAVLTASLEECLNMFEIISDLELTGTDDVRGAMDLLSISSQGRDFLFDWFTKIVSRDTMMSDFRQKLVEMGVGAFGIGNADAWESSALALIYVKCLELKLDLDQVEILVTEIAHRTTLAEIQPIVENYVQILLINTILEKFRVDGIILAKDKLHQLSFDQLQYIDQQYATLTSPFKTCFHHWMTHDTVVQATDDFSVINNQFSTIVGYTNTIAADVPEIVDEINAKYELLKEKSPNELIDFFSVNPPVEVDPKQVYFYQRIYLFFLLQDDLSQRRITDSLDSFYPRLEPLALPDFKLFLNWVLMQDEDDVDVSEVLALFKFFREKGLNPEQLIAVLNNRIENTSDDLSDAIKTDLENNIRTVLDEFVINLDMGTFEGWTINDLKQYWGAIKENKVKMGLKEILEFEPCALKDVLLDTILTDLKQCEEGHTPDVMLEIKKSYLPLIRGKYRTLIESRLVSFLQEKGNRTIDNLRTFKDKLDHVIQRYELFKNSCKPFAHDDTDLPADGLRYAGVIGRVERSRSFSELNAAHPISIDDLRAQARQDRIDEQIQLFGILPFSE